MTPSTVRKGGEERIRRTRSGSGNCNFAVSEGIFAGIDEERRTAFDWGGQYLYTPGHAWPSADEERFRMGFDGVCERLLSNTRIETDTGERHRD